MAQSKQLEWGLLLICGTFRPPSAEHVRPMGDFEPQDPEDEEELTGAAHAGGAPAVWRRAGQQPETQATLVRPPFPPPADADDAFGDGPLHGDDPDTGDEPPVDPHGAEVVTQQLQEFVAQVSAPVLCVPLPHVSQCSDARLGDAVAPPN